jgi:hypothetical protein
MRLAPTELAIEPTTGTAVSAADGLYDNVQRRLVEVP